VQNHACDLGPVEGTRERRETVERYHPLKDFEEDFVVAKQAAKTREERQRLMNEMGAYRQKHRQEDVARGKRGRIQMHAIMWPRWIEVAVNHEMAAREIYAELVEGRTDRLREEFNQSLVAVAASACTIEAVRRCCVPDFRAAEGPDDRRADPVGRRARALSLDCDRAAPRARGHRLTDAGSDNRNRLTAPRPMGSDVATSICLVPRSNDRSE
jgi:hypothetical protein